MRKIYWQTHASAGPVWVGDPTEALYVETSPAHLLELAQKLQAQGLIQLDGYFATPNPPLMQQAEKFEADMRTAQGELEKKHAFERG
jgi:hypothetical protein